MSRFEHLDSYSIRITAKAPLFIGSGKSFTKKEYYYNTKENTVSILNEYQLMNLIIDNGLLPHYEKFIMDKPSQYLKDFFEEWGVTIKEIEAITRYTTDVGNALMPDKSLVEIVEFIRNKEGLAYIPGSSIKGALRTALLCKMINDDNLSEKYVAYLGNKPLDAKTVESELLNTLTLSKKKGDAVNSIMKGIIVSDSEPVPQDRMVLCRKDDMTISGNIQSLNIIRECIKPGTLIKARLTLDKSVLNRIDGSDIKSAIEEFGIYYSKQYVSKYHPPANWSAEDYSKCLILGGGTGYFSKNIVYPLLPGQSGLKYVSNLMSNKFRRHKHEQDIGLGISPKLLKCTTYNGKLYHMGVCKIDINEEV